MILKITAALNMSIDETVAVIVASTLIDAFVYFSRKHSYIKKSILIVFEKYKIYKESGSIVFESIHPLMTGSVNPDEYCAIHGNTFILKGTKYNISKELKMSYSIPLLQSRTPRLYVYINDEKLLFNSLRIRLENVVAFLVIIYLIQNNINQINFEIINDILIKLYGGVKEFT